MTERNFDDLMPEDPLMAIAWADSLRFALGRDDILAAFRAETGIRWEPGKTGLDRLIDEATDADYRFIRAFAAWHNKNIWGEDFL
jgi:hypothetical protein